MRRKRLLVALVVSGLLMAIAVAGEYWHSKRLMRRFSNIGSYVTALEHYRLEGQTPPQSLRDLIETYNVYEHRLTNVPMYPEFLSPIYRPAVHLKGGPYIVFIEGPSARWCDNGRFIVYAYPDGHMAEIPYVSSGKLKELVRKDDLLRASQRERSPGKEQGVTH